MASLVVIDVVLDAVLLGVFVPVNTYYAPDIAAILSILVASLIVGYVFAAKIQEESRRRAISRIAVLSAVVIMFATMALFTNPYMETAMNESLKSMFSTSSWATWDWVAYSQFVMVMLVAVNVVFALLFGFIGLYVGSMLRQPAKSQK